MKKPVRTSRHITIFILSIVVAALTIGLASASEARADEADAKRLLKAMSDYMAAQNAISFGYDSILEIVTQDEQKLALASSGAVTLNRPDRVRATRSGGFVDIEMLFDGKTLTLLGKAVNIYTQVDVPGTVAHLIDELRDKYHRPLPAADLLLPNAYDELMLDVVDIKDLGSGVIGGVECDFLAFRKEHVDFQIWIAQGDRPYPCRFVITSRLVANGPQYSIQIRDWKTGDAVASDDFSFRNTTNADQIALKDLQDQMNELPKHFTEGEAQ
ncbi:MAG: DUF2092 domain-containing protein [Alphaproteobacteria bacterium]|nr:DUF2092 domain-containing protein [Alphaproteobacteria bacterium]